MLSGPDIDNLPEISGEQKPRLCRTCLAEKPISDFGKRSRSKDGVNYACKQCERSRVAIWQERNRARYNKSMRDWCARNPDRVKAHNKAYWPKYWATNAEAIKAKRAIIRDAKKGHR